MNLGEFRTTFKSRLNRSDCSDADALGFIDEGIKRVHRQLRSRLLERVDQTLVVDANSRAPIPADYLEMIALWAPDATRQHTKKNIDDFLRNSSATTDSAIYTRRGGYFYFKPSLEEGAELTLDYFAKTGLDTADLETDSTFLDEAWDLLLYASLSAAGNHFEDDREAKWDAQFMARLTELNDQFVTQEQSEGIQVVSPGTSTDY